jgi:Tol biopolymer transport system component
MELTSEPVPVLERLSTTNQGAANYVVSRDGLLVYVEGTDSMAVRRSLVWVSRDGREEVLKTEGRAFADPRLSADDRHAVVEINDQPDDIWTLDVARGTVTRQSFEVGEDETPIWMPDARSIVYSSSRAGQTRAIYGRRSDGVGGEDTYWSGREHVHVDDVTSDGRALIVSASVVNGGQADLMRVPLAGGDQKLEPLLQTPFTEYGARLSPDGRAIAYVSSESGGQEVYVRSFPSLENKTRVSTAGGIAPTWSRRGGELHFLTREAMMAVSVDTRSAIAVGTPQALFENRYFLKSTAHTAYDVARDGRFLMVKEVPLATQAGQAHLQIVLNWFEELEAKVR